MPETSTAGTAERTKNAERGRGEAKKQRKGNKELELEKKKKREKLREREQDRGTVHSFGTRKISRSYNQRSRKRYKKK